MKKVTLLLITILLFSAVNCFAYTKHRICKEITCPLPCCGLRDGFYAGLAGGYDSYKIKAALFPPPGSGISNLSSNPNMNATGFLGGLFAGYGRYFDIFYLGTEIFGNYSSATTSYSLIAPIAVFPATYNVTLTARASYGAGILPGIKINANTLIYGRADYSRTNLAANETAIAQGAGSAILNTDKWVGGFKYGIGIETQIYRALSFRGEYTHTQYSSFKTTLSRFTPSDNQFMLGLLYHFC